MISRRTLSRALFSELKEVIMCLACNLEKRIKITDNFGGDTPLTEAACFSDIMYEYVPFEDRSVLVQTSANTAPPKTLKHKER